MKKRLHANTPKGQGKIKGVFSLEEVRQIKAGSAWRDVRHKTFWFCQELEDGNYEAQALGPHHIPSGPIKPLHRDDFLKRYVPEPAMYFSLVYPSMVELDLTITRGDSYRNIKKYDRAEKEYNKALWIDEENIRATFGLALTYLSMGDIEKANLVFERLVSLDSAFRPEHKHLFNEFGIKLRKNGLYKQAIIYYSRALELTREDEHLFFNLARVHFECNDPGNSLQCIMKAVELNPELEPAAKLLRWIMVKKLVPAGDMEKAASLLALTTLSLSASSSFLEDELDSFLEEELNFFLDDHEELLLLSDALVPEAEPETVRLCAVGETPDPDHAGAGMTPYDAQPGRTPAGQPARLLTPEAQPGLPDPAEPQPPPPPGLHRRRRMSAVRALRKAHKR